jgi:hypothetical protein
VALIACLVAEEKKKYLLLLLGIQPRPFGRPAPSLLLIPSELLRRRSVKELFYCVIGITVVNEHSFFIVVKYS